MRNNNSLPCRLAAMALTASIAAALLPEAVFGESVSSSRTEEAKTQLQNPRIVVDNTGKMESGQKVTWDCV